MIKYYRPQIMQGNFSFLTTMFILKWDCKQYYQTCGPSFPDMRTRYSQLNLHPFHIQYWVKFLSFTQNSRNSEVFSYTLYSQFEEVVRYVLRINLRFVSVRRRLQWTQDLFGANSRRVLRITSQKYDVNNITRNIFLWLDYK